MNKIYVHHLYSETFFIRLFHNTNSRVFNITNNVGNVSCVYNDVEFNIIFNPEIHNNDDGFHILDTNADWNFNKMTDEYVDDINVIHNFLEITKDKKDWLINIFRTEKLLGKYDTKYEHQSILRPKPIWIEELLNGFANHKIISDNIFINDLVYSKYPNHYFAFTNTIHRWNEMISIRWFYEFKQVYDKLNFDYDLMYSVRNHRTHRINILNQLSKLNNPKILLQQTNSIQKNITSLHPNINFNSIIGDTDFSNLNFIDNFYGVNWDIFFRMLSKAKMQVLDESWSFQRDDFNSQYLSEKTIGLILAGIPFISTHSYPLSIIEKILEIEPHPFNEDFKLHKGNAELFVKFVEKFMLDFDTNYKVCKEWTDVVHTKFLNKLNTENSLLDLIIDNFKIHNNHPTSII